MGTNCAGREMGRQSVLQDMHHTREHGAERPTEKARSNRARWPRSGEKGAGFDSR